MYAAIMAFSAICVFFGSIGGAAFLGYRHGERDWQISSALTQEAMLSEQYGLAVQDMNAERYELAIERLNWILERDPFYPGAAELLTDAIRLANATPTPTPTITPTVIVTPTPVQANADPDELLAQAEELYAAENWLGVIEVLEALIGIDPAYQTDHVEQMLFEALVAQGRAYLAGGELEAGIQMIDRANIYRQVGADVLAERNLAEQYLDAIRTWGVDWDRTIERLEELYQAAPGYLDVGTRLFNAHVAYGDSLMARTDYCPALQQYTQALHIMGSDEVEGKRAQAAEGCRNATPTPIPSVSGIYEGPVSVPGFPGGRLAYEVVNPDIGVYCIMVLDGASVSIVDTGRLNPSWRRDGGGIVYSGDPIADGAIYGTAPDGSWITIVSGEEGANLFPSYSPDGTRIAFARREAGGTTGIWIAPANGGAAYRLAGGKSPIWGPTGFIAYNDGSGIVLDNPDDGPGGARVTTGPEDFPHSWSPDGQWVAFTSPADGDWDVYKVSIAGEIVQLTNFPYNEGAPAWSPDGSTIAFISNQSGDWAIYLVGSEGGDPWRIVDLGARNPYWPNNRMSWGP